MNDLTGREWVFWTRSVITKPYPPNLQHALRNRHGGQKPPELCADLVRAFTQAGPDRARSRSWASGECSSAPPLRARRPRASRSTPSGSRSTARSASREGIAEQETIVGDARECPGARWTAAPSTSSSPTCPYWKMDTASRSRGDVQAGGGAAPPPSERASCRPSRPPVRVQGGVAGRDGGGLRVRPRALLKPGGYLVTFIGDMYRDNRYHCLSADLAAALSQPSAASCGRRTLSGTMCPRSFTSMGTSTRTSPRSSTRTSSSSARNEADSAAAGSRPGAFGRRVA